MELTLEQQTMAFLWSFVLGVVLAVVYITVSVIRVLSPPTRIQLFISDILFMVFSAIMNFLFACAFTEGKVRFYTIFAELVSFIILYLTLGRGIKKIVGIVYKWISSFFRKITKPISNFIGKSVTFAEKKFAFMLKKVKKSKKSRHFPLHCQHRMLYNTNDKSVKR